MTHVPALHVDVECCALQLLPQTPQFSGSDDVSMQRPPQQPSVIPQAGEQPPASAPAVPALPFAPAPPESDSSPPQAESIAPNATTETQSLQSVTLFERSRVTITSTQARGRY